MNQYIDTLIDRQGTTIQQVVEVINKHPEKREKKRKKTFWFYRKVYIAATHHGGKGGKGLFCEYFGNAVSQSVRSGDDCFIKKISHMQNYFLL